MDFNIFEGADPFLRLLDVFDSVKEAFDKTKGGLAESIANDIRNTWQDWARSKSNREGWGEQYADSIKYIQTGEDTYKVYADGGHVNASTKLPASIFINNVEHGVKSWSIKDALLNGKNVKTTKTGKLYTIVPFRWRVPTKKKSQSTPSRNVIPEDVYKKLLSGENIGLTGNMKGLTRYKKESHGQWYTFRMVTQNSKGWIYPAISATPVFEEMLERYVRPRIKEIVGNYVKGLVKDMEKQHG